MGNGLLSREEIKALATDFGFEVSFDSPEPGVFDSTTGKLRDIEEHMTEILGEFNVIEEDYLNGSDIVAKHVPVYRYESTFEDYCYYEDLNIA